LHWTSDGRVLRLIYVDNGSGDAVLVVRHPNGQYYCIDDVAGSANPRMVLSNAPTGEYNIWLGTYSQGASADGYFYITQN
jgi:hypothetical protein